jgi:hypothetical protein
MPQRNHLVEPTNPRSSYGEYDDVRFAISFLGRKLVLNSIRVMGKVTVANNGDTTDIRMDNFIGGHTFFEEILTSTANQGLLETIQAYPRLVGMMRKSTLDEVNLMNSQYTCELCTPNELIARQVLKGNVLKTDSIDEAQSADFSIKPSFVFNQAEGDQFLSYSKTGDISLNLRLNRNDQVLFGTGADNTTIYTLSDLRLSFISVDDDGKVGSHIMRQKVTLQQPVQSSFVSISAKVPAERCVGVVASFMENKRQAQYQYNDCQQMELPNVSAVNFLFNDSESRFITYEITNNVDLMNRYLQAYRRDGETDATIQKIEANKSYGIGLNFEGVLDLSNQKFTTQITSDVSNLNPYTAYFYFFNNISM